MQLYYTIYHKWRIISITEKILEILEKKNNKIQDSNSSDESNSIDKSSNVKEATTKKFKSQISHKK